MEVRHIDHSGLGFSAFGLGTASLAQYTPVTHAFTAALQHSLRAGLAYIDTAPMYACGLAEELVGDALSHAAPPPLLSTKVGRLIRPLAGAPGNAIPPEHTTRNGMRTVFDFSAKGVRTSYRESLDRLGVKRTDIAILHDPDQHWHEAATEALPALLKLREDGHVSAVGIGMNQVELIERAVRQFDLDLVLVAGRYTLLDQGAARLLDLCAERGVGVVIGGVFNSGLLANPSGMFDYRSPSSVVQAKASRLAAICSEHGVDLKAAAMHFPLLHPAVSCVLIGPQNSRQLSELIDASVKDVPPELWVAFRREGLLLPG